MTRITLVRRILVGLAAGLVFGVVISEVTYFFLGRAEDRAPQVIGITIPPGTANKIRMGLPEPSIPDSMTFVVGDTLTVYNGDSETHQLGPLLIPPDSSASLKLDSVQSYAAECTFKLGQSLGLNIQPPLTIQTRLLGIFQAGLPMGFLFVLYGVFAFPKKEGAPQ